MVGLGLDEGVKGVDVEARVCEEGAVGVDDSEVEDEAEAEDESMVIVIGVSPVDSVVIGMGVSPDVEGKHLSVYLYDPGLKHQTESSFSFS